MNSGIIVNCGTEKMLTHRIATVYVCKGNCFPDKIFSIGTAQARSGGAAGRKLSISRKQKHPTPNVPARNRPRQAISGAKDTG